MLAGTDGSVIEEIACQIPYITEKAVCLTFEAYSYLNPSVAGRGRGIHAMSPLTRPPLAQSEADLSLLYLICNGMFQGLWFRNTKPLSTCELKQSEIVDQTGSLASVLLKCLAEAHGTVVPWFRRCLPWHTSGH